MKRKSIRWICGALLCAMTLTSFVGCAKQDAKSEGGSVSVPISGSTSVGPFMEIIAEIYQQKHPEVSIEINQTGSGPGIKDTMGGVNEIGMSSRDLKPEESSVIKPITIAYDGIAIAINKENPVKNLTVEQLKDIYTGKITNWNQIPGGNDQPIVVASREEGSGTRDAFQTLIGYKSEDLIPNALVSNGNGAVKEMVIGNPNVIGFLSFDYLDDSINVPSVNGVEAKAENVISKKYKLSRPFLALVKEDRITKNGQNFIDFILSDEGQKIIEENKLIKIN